MSEFEMPDVFEQRTPAFTKAIADLAYRATIQSFN